MSIYKTNISPLLKKENKGFIKFQVTVQFVIHFLVAYVLKIHVSLLLFYFWLITPENRIIIIPRSCVNQWDSFSSADETETVHILIKNSYVGTTTFVRKINIYKEFHSKIFRLSSKCSVHSTSFFFSFAYTKKENKKKEKKSINYYIILRINAIEKYNRKYNIYKCTK